jgi:PAS domain S-box-containing protein
MSKILIADDIEENRYFLEALLQGHGYQVVSAVNGVEALARARAEKPDLIVTDILMPVMDGFALCREFKKDSALADTPFVFYTATYTDRKDKDFGLSLGADRYLLKPMEPDLLMEILREVMEERAHKRLERAVTDLEDESGYLKKHNEALIRKLESKMTQLEEANRLLRRELAERKQAEIQLRRLYTAIENAAECIVITDEKGGIEYVNPAFEKTTGLRKEDARSLDPDLMPDGLRDEPFYRALWNALLLKKPWKGHLGNKCGNGEPVEFDITTSPIPDSNGGTSGFVIVMRDVTEQKMLTDQLIQAQKLEAIGVLAGGIAHDFNNVLGVVMGYTDLSLLDVPEEGKVRKNLNSLLKACGRAKELVSQILTFSRNAERKMTLVDLGPLIKETIKFLRAAIPSTIEIRTSLEAGCAMALADPVQIHQVILNLGINAAHSMRYTGGVLEVVLRKVEFDENTARQYPSLSADKYLLLSLSDTGSGMSKETLSRIFEPFFTTKKDGEGTGLGLSVAHGIIQSHGGCIAAYSEEGHGSTFNVYLPVAEGLPKNQEEADSLPLPVGTERILFVDDEEDLVDIGRQTLKWLGYRVTALTSSVDALDLFRSTPDGFDLVITDQTMPRLTGVELAKEIFKIRPDCPVIICTGFTAGISEEETGAPCIRHIIMKPLTIKEMSRTIRSMLDGG